MQRRRMVQLLQPDNYIITPYSKKPKINRTEKERRKKGQSQRPLEAG
jgi:hypothetical protein